MRALLPTGLLLLAVAAGAARADPTDLADVPKSAVQDAGQLTLGVTQDLYSPDGGSRDTKLLSRFGLFGRAELGLDVDDVRGGADWNLDGKLLLLDRGDFSPVALAAGFDDWGPDTDSLVYLVAGTALGPVELTAGLGGIGRADLMAAAEVGVARSVTLFVEYFGPEDTASAGFDWDVTDRFGIEAYWTRGTKDKSDALTLSLTITFGA